MKYDIDSSLPSILHLLVLLVSSPTMNSEFLRMVYELFLHLSFT